MAKLPLPFMTDEIKKFLSSPQNVSLHDFRQTQRLWPPKSESHALFKTAASPLHSDITLVQDSSSAAFVDFHEENISEVGLTAKNSTSLHRSPVPPNLSVKGEPTNYPFWPGGIDDSVIHKIRRESYSDTTDISSGSSGELLTRAPGLLSGMTFRTIEEQSLKTPTLMDISEVIFKENAVCYSVECKNKGSPVLHNAKIESIGEDSYKELETVLRGMKNIESPPEEANENWAVPVNSDELVDDITNMAHEYPFELDLFQKQAIQHLEKHENVFVAAHTSAGKTVVAEYAIALSRDHHTRVIYTSPIKALSNQKFREFRKTFGDDSVGLLTGDIQLKTEAPCLIMTTEILRSMLYNGSDVIRDVEWVIFDEVHYINDTERGVVWEEVLIMLPDHIGIIMLSATVPNAKMFGDWVGRTKQKKIFVITTLKRPVPLRHYLYTGNSKQTSTELFEIVHNNEIDIKSYSKAIQALKERSSKGGASQFGSKLKPRVNPKQEKNIWMSLVNALQKKDKLPVIAFTFSRKRCDANADSLTTLDLLSSSSEKSEVHVFFQKCISRLKGSDTKLPQITWMRDLLKRGIAVHHSGILPILKEVIELLFQKGLVRLLFATETFAMGVNMPARTVIFDSNRKHDGTSMRDLNPGEYIQMAGRAGRRSLDDDGTVILLCKAEVPEISDLKNMILGKPTSLESQFRLTYSMILNLLRVETLRVTDMMKRSYAEIDLVRKEVNRTVLLEKLKRKLESGYEVIECDSCSHNIEDYYEKCFRLCEINIKMQNIYLSQAMKILVPGRIVTIYTSFYGYSLAIILQIQTKRTSRVLMLCDAEHASDVVAQSLIDTTVQDSSKVQPFKKFRELFLPHPPIDHAVVDIPNELLYNITDEFIETNWSQIISDYNKRQLPRFRHSPPSMCCSKAVQELSHLTETYCNGCPVRDLKIKDLEYIQMSDEKKILESVIGTYDCIQCPQFKKHFMVTSERIEIEKKISDLKFMLSENSLQLLPEYESRISVLKKLSFINDGRTVELKGRVACELHTQEVLLTELLFQNILSGLKPAEIVALLSCFVFQQSNCSEPNLCDTLKKGKHSIIEVATKIAEVENDCGLDVSTEDSLKELKFGLVEVVYEWANGREFVEIVTFTDVSEGMIVRCIQRLEEMCRDVHNAAKVIGDSTLSAKMQTASTLIKRDIVFAASLYIQ